MQRFELDAQSLRPYILAKAADVLRRGGLLALPTDTAWSVVCDARDRSAAQRLRDLRATMAGKDPEAMEKAPMSLICRDMNMVGTYTLLNAQRFRFVKRILPGPYTVILPASREVPRVLQSKRRDVGVRLPDDGITTALVTALAAPVLAATCQRPDGSLLSASPEVEAAIGRHLAALIESTAIIPEPSTVIDYTGDEPIVIRAGKGAVDDLV